MKISKNELGLAMLKGRIDFIRDLARADALTVESMA